MIRRGRAVPALLLLMQSACFPHRATVPDAEAAEAARHRSALATLTVDNATSRHLRITVRSAPRPASEITIGELAAGADATLAPIPAGEPVILAAVADDSSRLSLPARSFDIGEHWTWRIPAEAVFLPPGSAP